METGWTVKIARSSAVRSLLREFADCDTHISHLEPNDLDNQYVMGSMNENIVDFWR